MVTTGFQIQVKQLLVRQKKNGALIDRERRPLHLPYRCQCIFQRRYLLAASCTGAAVVEKFAAT
jgi:hypothetical protein